MPKGTATYLKHDEYHEFLVDYVTDDLYILEIVI